MPLGSSHDETGRLWREERWLTLHRDAAGRWRLDVDHGAERMLGQRVRVVGVRSGFDLHDLRRIGRAG